MTARDWTSRLAAAVLGLVLLVTAVARAEPSRVLVSAQRLVKLFNFESIDAHGQKIGASHQLPEHWYVIGRPAGTTSKTFLRQPLNERLIHRAGFPAYTQVGFSSRYATSGQYSFHLGLNGGSVGAFLEVGTLPAMPGSDYVITARVRTQGLKYAAGRLLAYFITSDGRRIAASIQRTGAIRTQGRWTTVAVKLAGRFEQAAWIGLQLEVLQPQRSSSNPLGTEQIVLQDVHGGAWFDDIAIWQTPHVEVGTQSRVNVIRAPAKPQLHMSVRDLTGQALVAAVRVYDLRLGVVASQKRLVGAGHAGRWMWTPALKRYGWYLVELEVRGQGYGRQRAPLARTIGAFLWLPRQAGASGAEAAKFGLMAAGMEPTRRKLMPALLKASGLGRLVVSAWRRDTKLSDLESRQTQLSNMLVSALGGNRRVDLSFYPVPEALAAAAGVPSAEPMAVLSGKRAVWLAYLTAVLRWQGQDVRQWMIGSLRAPSLFFVRDLPRMVEALQKQLRAMAPGPTVVIPWRLAQARRADMPSDVAYAVDVSPGIAPAELPAYLKSWSSSSQPYWLNLREPPATVASHVQRVRDLVLRMIEAWSVRQPEMMLPRPWTGAAQRQTAILPDPLLGAFTETAARLSGRRVIGQLPVGDGLKVLILDGPAGGMLAAWNVHSPRQRAVLDMYLGENPVVWDVWGNHHPLEQRGRRHHVRLTQTPTFITGINPQLAMLRASFHLKPSFIESLQQPHERVLTLSNPWRRTISGRIRIIEPEGWSIHPRERSFTIASGKTAKLALTLDFPIDEVAGDKKLTARVRFTADKPYDILLSAPMKLGLSDVEFDATLAVEASRNGGAGKRDAVVDCVVTNTGKKRQALYVFANLRGHPRQERLIPRLDPGESVVRRFRFTDAGKQIDANRPVWAGVRQTNGPAILNKKLRFGP